MGKIEILAPAGGADSVVAAVRSGADAVYLGAKEFSARGAAENFDEPALKSAIDYCHIRGARVYLAANTLLFDDELKRAVESVKTACALGADAVIVQDIGFARLLKSAIPSLRLHASTQMSIHTLSGAKALYELGFSRVVLARELSRDEIAQIAQNCDIELEVFVHGALCMSVSGQCCFSAMLGGRSANRGHCAQPCRLPFEVPGGSGHALSLKDQSLVGYIQELQSMGVASAKIEGRMKRPEYVAAATAACVQSRDRGFVSKQTEGFLTGVFSRSGFTDGYYTARRDKEMFGVRRREDVTSASDSLLKQIKNTYKDELQRVGVTMQLNAAVGRQTELTVSDGKSTVTVKSELAAQSALNRPLTSDSAEAQLTKTGSTPYRAAGVKVCLDGRAVVPVAVLNSLRRQALEKLSELRARVTVPVMHEVELTAEPIGKQRRQNSSMPPVRYRARFTDTDVPAEFSDAELIYVPLFSKLAEIKRLMSEGFKVAAEIPRAMFSADERITERLGQLAAIGITDVLASNIGAVYLARRMGLVVHGGFGLNITNTQSMIAAQRLGLADAELSFELEASQIAALGGSIPRGFIADGYLPLMLVRNCPNTNSSVTCAECFGRSQMQDRRGEKFMLCCDSGATEILNCVRLSIPEKLSDFSGTDFFVFRFSVENHVEKVENKLIFSSNHQKNAKITRGLYYRGVK